jgi:hypothetical protein
MMGRSVIFETENGIINILSYSLISDFDTLNTENTDAAK